MLRVVTSHSAPPTLPSSPTTTPMPPHSSMLLLLMEVMPVPTSVSPGVRPLLDGDREGGLGAGRGEWGKVVESILLRPMKPFLAVSTTKPASFKALIKGIMGTIEGWGE